MTAGLADLEATVARHPPKDVASAKMKTALDQQQVCDSGTNLFIAGRWRFADSRGNVFEGLDNSGG